MPLTTRFLYVVACDVCRTEYTDFETEATVYFEDETTAEQIIRSNNWHVMARNSPDRFICPERDADHQARMDELMPPEPVTQVPGQLSLHGTDDDTTGDR